MKNSGGEPSSLLDSLPDYLKPFEKVSKIVQIPFPKRKIQNLFDLKAVEEMRICWDCSFRHKNKQKSMCRAHSKIVWYLDNTAFHEVVFDLGKVLSLPM